MRSILSAMTGACIVLMALPCGSVADAAGAPESTRSAPQDTTPYVRPAVPEDYCPFGRPAIGPEVLTAPRDDTRESPPPATNPEGKRNPTDTSEERTKVTE